MYYTRYKYHREIYNHKAVKSIELMIADILLESNSQFNFPSIIESNDFLNLDDSIISRIKYSNECLDLSKNLIERIYNRDLYKKIYKHTDFNYTQNYMEDKYPDMKSNDYHIVKLQYDFCNDIKNPFEKVRFYNNKLGIIDYKDIIFKNLYQKLFVKLNMLYTKNKHYNV